MIQRVWEQASLAGLDKLVVATDDARIYDHVSAFGHVVMTSPHHLTGTDRCAEAIEQVDPEYTCDVVINIQGDQPFIDPIVIMQLARAAAERDLDMSTLSCPIEQGPDLVNPAIVKVVVDANDEALYFSRSPVPFVQGIDRGAWLESHPFRKHIGTYAFKRSVLAQLGRLPSTPLEQAEQLEQLRWLEHGYAIYVHHIATDIRSIDTPEQLP
jgi:3-deoxy-manno-octulosonate cytidylyltransferase (CMP-KDO synthetase)